MAYSRIGAVEKLPIVQVRVAPVLIRGAVTVDCAIAVPPPPFSRAATATSGQQPCSLAFSALLDLPRLL